jgi:hypothetical protein
MDDFLRNFMEGLVHVLDINAYDHILFIILMAVPFLFNSWKKLVWLVTAFTVGHSMSLLLAVYGIVTVGTTYIEFLIPVTVAVAALYNIFMAGKRQSKETPWLLVSTALFFGLIHGFGFSGAFKMLASSGENTLSLLAEFALGIEAAQLLIVLFVLIINFIFTGLFRFNKKEWIQIISAIVFGIIVPMLAERWLW